MTKAHFVEDDTNAQMKKEKPLSEKIKKMFDKWSMLDDVRIKALNPETLEILLNIILKENKEAVEELKKRLPPKDYDMSYPTTEENKAYCDAINDVKKEIDKIFGFVEVKE